MIDREQAIEKIEAFEPLYDRETAAELADAILSLCLPGGTCSSAQDVVITQVPITDEMAETDATLNGGKR